MIVVVLVVDRNTGRPIDGALVQLDSYVAYTDTAGRAILDVPPGRYTVRVGRSGYRYESMYLALFEPSEVTVRLTPSMVIL